MDAHQAQPDVNGKAILLALKNAPLFLFSYRQ